MKQLTWRLVLPLTVISFGTFTKWWYVLPVDAPDTMMAGFPLAWVSEGWWTSMSLQIFLAELFFDFLVIFLFWFLLIFLVKCFLKIISVPKILTVVMLSLSALFLALAIFITTWPEVTFKIKRDWSMQVMVTGYKMTWTTQDRPDFMKYYPRKK